MNRLLLLIPLGLLGFFPSKAQTRFWGMSASKGSVKGTIFNTDSAGKGYADVYTFNDVAEGTEPYGSLIQAADGNLYGMTSKGGANNYGVIFRYNPVTNVYTRTHDFDSVNGQNPYGSLVQASNGRLYGMTYSGGSMRKGMLFEYEPGSGSFTNKVAFDMVNAGYPFGSLIQAADGMLYGLSSAGGGDATGCLFQFDPVTGVMGRRYSFILGPSYAGYEPHGSLIQARNGHLYGFSRYGKLGFESGGGVVFKYDLAFPYADGFIPQYYFDEEAPDSLNGYDLMGSLLEAANGKLYGMTNKGGPDGAGTIFEYNITDSTLTKLYDFKSSTDGYRSYGSLIQGPDTKLYGLTTSEGGQAKLFQFDLATNTLTVTADVTGTPFYTSLLQVNTSGNGIAEAAPDKAIDVFPNPAGEQIMVRSRVPGMAYRLLDLCGRELQQGLLPADGALRLPEIPGGQYILRLDKEALHWQRLISVRP